LREGRRARDRRTVVVAETNRREDDERGRDEQGEERPASAISAC
jgi:hypothetical protein